VGAAIERDSYEPRDEPRFRYSHSTPGVFVQDDVDVTTWLTVSASGRIDVHSEYGTFFSPRVSGLLRLGEWSSRLSVGSGFFAPTPLTEETEAAGLTRLTVPNPIAAERGRSVSIDFSRALGPVTGTVTFFGSRVTHPVDVDRDGTFTLVNLPDPTTTAGVEVLGTYRREPFFATMSYSYVRGRETEGGARTDIPLTPRHSAGVVGMWEQEGRGRIGVELFYTGRQRLEVNPFRRRSEPYVVAGVLVERRFGGVRVFLNAENITDVRQTRWDPLVRPIRAPDGRWTVDAWAPLEGRVINGGIRWEF
jgi:iron complex outermembrane receptor protein